MKAGKLNLWMTHYRRTPGIDDIGEPSPTFAPVASFNAGVQPVGGPRVGDEFFNTGHMLIRIDRVFEVRYADVRAEDRVAVNGVMYDVLGVAGPEETNSDGYQLRCKNSD